ncbi:hypothetical protein RHGRI_008956 [Rhododendron griersonianum]|uniref:GIY-YIG domain-containing protein n=1 Tax=Rhododendron griersonianum TaxID=479676 RepID=A0AAV6L369_9ERIC|nr:hypothetical protein RHGRI_008956 [Rhododendron griersonianum]
MRTALLSLLLLLDLFLCSLSLPSLDSNGSLAEFPNATALESNTSRPGSKEDSFADMIDRALEKEFTENDEQTQATDPGSFNNSVNEQQAVLETVARVKSKKNDTKEEKSFQLQDVFNLDSENRAEDMPTLIDRKDNVFIISNLKSKYPVLQLDLSLFKVFNKLLCRLISDLVIVIVFATCGGIAFACAGQPVITGYLLAGSIVGPGGFNFVSELVQVETVAQFGVIFLLFALGLEFSTAKLRVVRAVAVLGGLLQIFLFMCLCGITASLCGGELSEGVFIGVFLSMSSTAVVLKFLMEKSSMSTVHGQITIGTLILQDCAVGLLFALLPVLGGTSGVLQGVISMTKSLVVLIAFLAILSILSRTCVPWFLKLMISLSSQTNELYQLAAVAFCLVVAWCSDKLGLSLELGSFAAGVMISTTEFAQHTLEQVEPIRNLFAALFLASIGMLIHGHFLWNHIDILLAAVILVIIIKTVVVATVVKGFRYNNKTSLLVGMSLAQIGEFAFVLLSRASNVHLVEGKLYLLLLGTTALSLVTTPLLFKLIPAVVHLGVLLRWFSPDIPIEIGFKGDILRADSTKRINLMVLVGPSDWEDHSLGKEGVERYRVHNLPDCYSCPGLYELGLVISGAHSGSKIGNLDPVIVYLGQTDNVRTRLQRYGRDGAHLDGLFSEAFSKDYSIAFRWAPMKNKAEAEKTETRVLNTYDYALNKGNNGVRRLGDVFQKLQGSTSSGAQFLTPAKKLSHFHHKKNDVKIDTCKPLSWEDGSRIYTNWESNDLLPQIFKFGRSQPRLVTPSLGFNDDHSNICGVALGHGSVCTWPPVGGRKRCDAHKGMKINDFASKKLLTEGKSLVNSSPSCGVTLDNGNVILLNGPTQHSDERLQCPWTILMIHFMQFGFPLELESILLTRIMLENSPTVTLVRSSEWWLLMKSNTNYDEKKRLSLMSNNKAVLVANEK